MPKKTENKDAVFHSMYERLNKKQREAVDTIEGPVMVIAGPGTGKTTILTLRIANILRKTDTPPSGILAITFTDAGVKAMRMKLREVIGNRADQVRIHTFHGFASSIINEFQDHFVHLSHSRTMTDIDGEEMIRKILLSENKKFQTLRPFGNPDFYVYPIKDAISDAKNDAITPAMIRVWVKEKITNIKNDDNNISTRGANKGELKAEAMKMIEKCEKTFIFADVYEQYEKEKTKEKLIDYDDLILELLHSFKTDELLLRIIQENFLYILVDEHQDTNDSQNLLISMLAEYFEVPNVFIVGDEKQAIYRFQGASVHNFLRFRKQWRNMKIISLEENYRSHQSILDASFGMIENNYEDQELQELRVRLRSGQNSIKNRPVDIIQGQNISVIEEHLVQELKQQLTKKDKESTAIIVKTNKDLERVIRLLENHNIPVSSLRNVNIFNHPVAMVFFDLVKFFLDPSDIESLSRTIVSGLWDLSFDESISIIKNLRSKREECDITEIIPNVNKIKNKITDDDVLGFIISMAEHSGLIRLFVKDPANVEVWRGIVNLSQALIHDNKINTPIELLAKLLAYKESSETKTVKVSVGTTDLPIQAMTAHGSKGLEYDYVYIMYANEEYWMGRERPKYFVLPEIAKINDEDNIKDARRLFYVALTRARKHVSVLYAHEDVGGRNLTPVRFIDELNSKHVKHIMLDELKVKNTAFISKSENNKNLFNKKLIDYSRNLIGEKGISVTALNHFLNCPSEFLIKSVLKLPESVAVLAEKGSAMHYAFANVWHERLHEHGAVDFESAKIAKIMKDSVSTYFDRSILSKKQKEIVLSDLLDKIPNISLALGPHFREEGKIYAETWSETILNFGDKKIPIHGKLDAIIDKGKEVLVFDYKSREKMSLAEIKGETKNSNGNYFRQLVFYRLLLENDVRFADKAILPSLVFIMPDEKGRSPIVGLPILKEDIEKVKNDINSLISGVWTGDILNTGCGKNDCDSCKILALYKH